MIGSTSLTEKTPPLLSITDAEPNCRISILGLSMYWGSKIGAQVFHKLVLDSTPYYA